VTGKRPWTLLSNVHIALPGATQNEVSGEEAEALVKAGVRIVAEGSNMVRPSINRPHRWFHFIINPKLPAGLHSRSHRSFRGISQKRRPRRVVRSWKCVFLFVVVNVFAGRGLVLIILRWCVTEAANAGGVAVSGLEMAQNSQRLAWTTAEVDAKLKRIMSDCYDVNSNRIRFLTAELITSFNPVYLDLLEGRN